MKRKASTSSTPRASEVRPGLLAAVVVTLYALASLWTWAARPPRTAPSPAAARAEAASPADAPRADAPRATDASHSSLEDELPTETLRLHARAPEIGERVEYETQLDLALDARVDAGLFRPSLAYTLREVEILRATRLPPREGRAVLGLEFTASRQTRSLPVVGKKERTHRVHGRSYLAIGEGQALAVERSDGRAPGDRESEILRRTAQAVGGIPPLHAALASGEATALAPGAVLHLDSDAARRLLGLPFEEIEVDDALLVLREILDGGARADFDATLRLHGRAELGEGLLELRGELAGRILVQADGMRLASLELTGRVAVEPAEGARKTPVLSGAGPLTLRRDARILPP